MLKPYYSMSKHSLSLQKPIFSPPPFIIHYWATQITGQHNMKYIHTEINFLREGEGVLQGKWGDGPLSGVQYLCLTTHICGIVIHAVG